MSNAEDDYVLGTRDDEIARLGLQHRIWRPEVTEGWRRAGITVGWKVLDVGAGPGYATVDLAEIVGPAGQVIAIERSGRFLDFAREACRHRGLAQVTFREADLMEESLGDLQCDAAWCRWVASFVSSPATLVAKIGAALKTGGVAIFHEYSDYLTWKCAPRRAALEEFTVEVMASWRANGGEPNVAALLPAILRENGLVLESVRPLVRVVRPSDYTWQWPASFIETNLARLQELGRVDAAWAEKVRRDFAAATADPTTLLTTPLFLELIARKSD